MSRRIIHNWCCCSAGSNSVAVDREEELRHTTKDDTSVADLKNPYLVSSPPHDGISDQVGNTQTNQDDQEISDVNQFTNIGDFDVSNEAGKPLGKHHRSKRRNSGQKSSEGKADSGNIEKDEFQKLLLSYKDNDNGPHVGTMHIVDDEQITDSIIADSGIVHQQHDKMGTIEHCNNMHPSNNSDSGDEEFIIQSIKVQSNEKQDEDDF